MDYLLFLMASLPLYFCRPADLVLPPTVTPPPTTRDELLISLVKKLNGDFTKLIEKYQRRENSEKQVVTSLLLCIDEIYSVNETEQLERCSTQAAQVINEPLSFAKDFLRTAGQAANQVQGLRVDPYAIWIYSHIFTMEEFKALDEQLKVEWGKEILDNVVHSPGISETFLVVAMEKTRALATDEEFKALSLEDQILAVKRVVILQAEKEAIKQEVKKFLNEIVATHREDNPEAVTAPPEQQTVEL